MGVVRKCVAVTIAIGVAVGLAVIGHGGREVEFSTGAVGDPNVEVAPAQQPAPPVLLTEASMTCVERSSGLRDGYNASVDGTVVYTMKVARGTRGDSVESVCGIPIEPIDSRSNAKVKPSQLMRGFTYLLPMVLPQLSSDAKRVWLDLGARMYPKGSTAHFQHFYPESRSFEAHAFELLDLKDSYAPAHTHFRGGFTFHQVAAWTHNSGVAVKGLKMAKVSDGIESIKGDKRKEWKAPSVDMAEFLQKNFRLSDFVVMKIDIEGGEWTLLPHLQRTGAIALIDELFLECHPLDYGDYAVSGNMMPQICIDLTNDLRTRGVYTHRWF